MILGLLSDTHGHVDAMAAGVQILRRHGAAFIIHCGDVGSIAVLDHLAGIPSAFVWGNTDWDHRGLERYAETIGVQCLGAFGELTFDDKRIAVLHGDDFKLRSRILSEQNFNYLFQGHTHVRTDQTVGQTRIINPGALYRASVKTVATLDLPTNTLTFHSLPEP